MKPIRNARLSEIDGTTVNERFARRGVPHVVREDGAGVGRVVDERGEGSAGGCVDGAVACAAVGDVAGAFVGGETDAVGLHEGGIQDGDGAC